MKALHFIIALWLIVLAPSRAADDLDRIGYPFHWKGQAFGLLSQIPGTTAVADDVPGQPDKLTISRGESLWNQALAPGTYTLRILGPGVVSQLTSKHYAIVGHLAYRNVAPGSFLELENWFPPDQPGNPEQFYFSRTLADAGPLAKIEGSEAGRDFALPFDATGTKSPPVRLVFKLHLMGAGQLEFTNVRLVQYPDATTTTSATTPPAVGADRTNSLPKKDELNWRSFALGMLAAFAAVLLGTGLLKLGRRFRQLRHARELRRIASLDG
jgi:hypothetical protein